MPPLGPTQAASALLTLPEELLEEILIRTPLDALTQARQTCRALCEMSARPAVTRPHLMQATRVRSLPQTRTELKDVIDQQRRVTRSMSEARCTSLSVLPSHRPDHGHLVSVGETPAGAMMSLKLSAIENRLDVADARGETQWSIPDAGGWTDLTRRLSGDASFVLLRRPGPQSKPPGPVSKLAPLWIARQSTVSSLLYVPRSLSRLTAFGPYDDRLAVAEQFLDRPDAIHCFDTQVGRESGAWIAPDSQGYCTGLSFFEDAPVLATGLCKDNSSPASVVLLDVRTAKLANRVPTNVTNPARLAYAPSTQSLFIGGNTGLELYDLRAGRARKSLFGQPCDAVAIAPNGRWLAVNEIPGRGADTWRRLQFYDTNNLAAPLFDRKTRPGAELRFSRDGTRLYATGTPRGTCFDLIGKPVA